MRQAVSQEIAIDEARVLDFIAAAATALITRLTRIIQSVG
jgi:hypothetical protein